MKSRALWLEARDKNSKFFHSYATHRRNINTICEIKNHEGRLVRAFEEKADARVAYFQKIFKEPEGCPIQEILEVLGFFPRLITYEMNEELTNIR